MRGIDTMTVERPRVPWFVSFLARRLVWALITLVIFMTAVFVFMQIWVPYSWATQFGVGGPGAVDAAREAAGLNRPLLERYADFIGRPGHRRSRHVVRRGPRARPHPRGAAGDPHRLHRRHRHWLGGGGGARAGRNLEPSSDQWRAVVGAGRPVGHDLSALRRLRPGRVAAGAAAGGARGDRPADRQPRAMARRGRREPRCAEPRRRALARRARAGCGARGRAARPVLRAAAPAAAGGGPRAATHASLPSAWGSGSPGSGRMPSTCCTESTSRSARGAGPPPSRCSGSC